MVVRAKTTESLRREWMNVHSATRRMNGETTLEALKHGTFGIHRREARWSIRETEHWLAIMPSASVVAAIGEASLSAADQPYGIYI